jgi:hypothetical protein
MELIKFNHTTPEERSQLVREIFDEVLNGRINPLELHLRLKSAEEVIKQLTGMEPYKAILLDECLKHGKSFDYQTAKIDIREVGVKYDYSQCGCSQLIELYQQKEKLEEKIKALESYLKALPPGGAVSMIPNVTEDSNGKLTVDYTGELETHYPPAKTSTTSVAVTLK